MLDLGQRHGPVAFSQRAHESRKLAIRLLGAGGRDGGMFLDSILGSLQEMKATTSSCVPFSSLPQGKTVGVCEFPPLSISHADLAKKRVWWMRGVEGTGWIKWSCRRGRLPAACRASPLKGTCLTGFGHPSLAKGPNELID